MKVRIAAVVLVGFSCLPLLAVSQATSLWRIGRFDGSSAEFNDNQPHTAITYDAAQSRPDQDWYAFAPSAIPGKPVTPETAPRTIVFSLAGPPQRAYRLTVSVIIEHSSVPDLAITINGRKGR